MRILKVYEYPNCSTCKKAIRFLVNQGFALERVNIFENPPSSEEIAQMVAFHEGNFKKVFNTVGRVYQEKNLKDKMASLSEAEAIALLASDGRLIRRPFLLLEKTGLVGFNAELWSQALN